VFNNNHIESQSQALSFNRHWVSWMKWAFLILAYLFLAYKLITFTHYGELLKWWCQMPLLQCWWLAAVVMLLPINWLLEAFKWKMLTAGVEKINLFRAMKGVLAGISTGFFTPNRVGELVGRVIYLNAENRKAGVTLSVVNSLTQNLVMAGCGVPAALAFFYFTTNTLAIDFENFILIMLAVVLVFGLIYLELPKLSRFLGESSIALSIADFTGCLADYSRFDLFKIMLISLVRYAVFCVQFFMILRFFGIDLDYTEALIAIPTTYLFVTFSPSFAFSEAAVRSSYAVLFIGAYSGQVVNIALAGVSVWAINFIVPMLVGSLLLAKSE